MNEKIIDVLTVIAEGWNKRQTFDEILRTINNNFSTDEGTINVAFSIFFEKILQRKDQYEETVSKNRFFSDEEFSIIGKNNINYLLKLFNLKIINLVQLEIIIQEIMEMPDEEVDVYDINWLTLFVLTDFPGEMLPGSRRNLFSSDKIN